MEPVIIIYPVPANEYLQLDYQNIDTYFNLEVLNVQGSILLNKQIKAMLSGGSARIDLTQLTGEIYFIRFGNDSFSTTR